jgi:hypothetical protein
MNSELIQTDEGQYVKLSCEGESVSGEDDVIALLEACGEYQTHNLMIHEGCLHPDFYDLRTGLAGLVFHKFSLYRMRTAFIGQWAEIQSERFKELMYECNKGQQTRFFTSTPDAEEWLLAYPRN